MAKFTEIEREQVLIDLLLNEGWIARPTESPMSTVLTKTFGERVYNVRLCGLRTVSVVVTELHTDGFVQSENSRWLVPNAWYRSENHTIAYRYPHLVINNVKLKTSKRVRFGKNEKGHQTFLR
jgi:hypothetical protein